jgi:hypothetical protein
MNELITKQKNETLLHIIPFIPLYTTSLFAKTVFSKPPQELLLVALVQQEKISFCGTRLFAAIGARRLC